VCVCERERESVHVCLRERVCGCGRVCGGSVDDWVCVCVYACVCERK